MIVKNSVEFNIELNTRGNNDNTAFHYACMHGQSEIVEMIMKNSVEFNIELNVKDNQGATAFHLS